MTARRTYHFGACTARRAWSTRRAQPGGLDGMSKAKIAISLPPSLLATSKRAVKDGRAESVSAYVAAAIEAKAKRDELRGVLDALLLETGGPLTAAERTEAERMVGVKPR
jgi:Arc/MetJ-type ribon-helix-helix transcriptional regulator